MGNEIKIIKNKFVTAKLKGVDETRQGCVLCINPLMLVGESGEGYVCEGEPTIVENPPDECIGCDRPLGNPCYHCKEIFGVVGKVFEEQGVRLDVTERKTDEK